MSRAQDRSTGVPTGAQPDQPVTGTPGSATGATGASGASSASMHDQPATRTGAAPAGTTGTTGTTTSYARGTGTSASYGKSRSGTGAGAGGGGLGGVISMVTGLLAFFTGLAAVVRQSFFTSLPGYAYRWNVHGWGWVLLVLGVLLFAAGAVYLLGMGFGRLAAVGLAVLTAVAGFLFLPYSPIWGTIVVALSALAIWACLRDDSSARAANGGAADSGAGSGYGYGEGSMGGTGSMSSGTTTTTRSTRG
jgi:hypothetical protein